MLRAKASTSRDRCVKLQNKDAKTPNSKRPVNGKEVSEDEEHFYLKQEANRDLTNASNAQKQEAKSIHVQGCFANLELNTHGKVSPPRMSCYIDPRSLQSRWTPKFYFRIVGQLLPQWTCLFL